MIQGLDFSDLTDDDVDYLLNEIDNLSLDELEELYFSITEYETQPVDIQTFIDDPEYLGNYFAHGFREYWRSVLYDIFPSPVYSPYFLIVLRGSIGRGKTVTACVGSLYEMHKLLCMKNPQLALGLAANTKMVISLLSATLGLTDNVVWEDMTNMMSVSPYWQTYMKGMSPRNGYTFPKNIGFDLGSRVGHTLGKAVFGAVMDEANFGVIKDQVYKAFLSILRRMETRFLKAGVLGNLPGKIWVVSSESGVGSLINQLISKYEKKEGVYVDGNKLSNSAIWHVVPERYVDGKWFEMFVGTDALAAKLLADDPESHRIRHTFPERIIEVPEVHRDDFEIDPVSALQDLAGVSTVSTYKLFRFTDKLYQQLEGENLFPDIMELDFDDSSQIYERCLNEEYFYNLANQIPRAIHIDIGVTGDRLGFASCMLEGFDIFENKDPVTGKIMPELVPKTKTEFCFTIQGRRGNPVPLYKVRSFIYWLRQMGYPIFRVTFDGFQSTDGAQLLTKEGFTTEIISLDGKNSTKYMLFRDALYRGFHKLPISELLMKELKELEVDSTTGIVDHPESIDGSSKDLADAACGSRYVMEQNAHQFKILFMTEPEVSQRNSLLNSLWPDSNFETDYDID